MVIVAVPNPAQIAYAVPMSIFLTAKASKVNEIT